jgi:HAD superfamily hydrolase (TIGR01490 family)
VRLAFFDLDRTVLAVNSGSRWLRREVALGHLGKRDALRGLAWLVRYELGLVEGEEMMAMAVERTRGSSARELAERTAEFFEAEVRHTYRPGALEAIEAHRKAGDRLVLLTSSTSYLSEHVARELAFDEILCNQLEVGADGLHTGRVVGRICFGAGKLFHARAACERSGAALADCTFYTDSYSDRSVLEAVGRPVAVNPDPRLRRAAGQRGWATVDWGQPGPRSAGR